MNLKEQIDESWHEIIFPIIHQEPLKTLNEEILPNISFQPSKENIFRVFNKPLKSIKIVILGQDPYPTSGDAIGLSFINGRNRIPVSLKNIYKEIKDSTNTETVNPLSWENQGVFLLNTALTVETGNAGSHLIHWKNFIRKIIHYISIKNPCIWLLWGKKAEIFSVYINNKFNVKGYDKETIKQIPTNEDLNYIMTAPHPAAESYANGKAGFFGCNHFYYVNEIINNKKLKKINW